MNPTILLLEPNKTNRDALKEILKGTKYMIVQEVSYGEEALELFDKLHPEVVMLCLLAPGNKSGTGLGGINLVTQFADTDPDARIVVTYTLESKYLVMAALKAGARAHLKKPFTKEGVLHALGTAFTARHGTEAVKKRQSLRLKKPMVVHYKKSNEGFFAKMRSVISDDISVTGISFKTNEAIPERAILKLKMEFPGLKRVIKATGQVVRAKPVPGLNLADLGINFVKIDEKDREMIKDYVLDMISKGAIAPK